jgi:hypothetical protein
VDHERFYAFLKRQASHAPDDERIGNVVLGNLPLQTTFDTTGFGTHRSRES